MVGCSQNTTKVYLLWLGGSHSSIQLHVSAIIRLYYFLYEVKLHIYGGGVLVNSDEISFT
jgi:hypothetical protein